MTSATLKRPDTIRLQDAPEHVFDRDKWQLVVDGSSDREAALHDMCATTIGAHIYMIRLTADQPTVAGAQARRELQAYETGQHLLADLKGRLRTGEILATGMSALALDRVSIPVERWDDLHLDILKGTAEGQITFTDVRLSLSRRDADAGEGHAAACIEWLRHRKAEGVTLKKQLKAEAEVRFPDLASRAFDAAYKKVFETSRGRPRKRRPQ